MNLQILEHNEFGEIRTATDEKGNILFCGSDVAKALGYSNQRDAITRHCKGVVKHDTLTMTEEYKHYLSSQSLIFIDLL